MKKKNLKFPNEVTLTITKNDIEDGIPSNPYKCAISKSATRRFSTLLGCEVKCSTGIIMGVYPEDITKKQTYDLGDKGNSFITQFDSDKTKVKPCRITLTKRKVS